MKLSNKFQVSCNFHMFASSVARHSFSSHPTAKCRLGSAQWQSSLQRASQCFAALPARMGSGSAKMLDDRRVGRGLHLPFGSVTSAAQWTRGFSLELGFKLHHTGKDFTDFAPRRPGACSPPGAPRTSRAGAKAGSFCRMPKPVEESSHFPTANRGRHVPRSRQLWPHLAAML